MIRRAFIRRMTMAALASGMLGTELLGKSWKPLHGTAYEVPIAFQHGWHPWEMADTQARRTPLADRIVVEFAEGTYESVVDEEHVERWVAL